MGRPKLLDKHKRSRTDKDGKIIKLATKETLAKIEKVCLMYAKTGKSIVKCLDECGVCSTYFYKCIRTFGNCKDIANKCGLGLIRDAEVRPAKIIQQKPRNDAYTLFDMPCRKEWTDTQKQNAIQIIIKELRGANSFAKAVCYANANMKIVAEWMREEPGLGDLFRKAESECSSYMGKCVVKSMGVAAEKGKVGEVILGCERRFPEQWGKIDSIDITTRNEHDQRHIVTISGDEARMIEGEMEIEEL